MIHISSIVLVSFILGCVIGDTIARLNVKNDCQLVGGFHVDSTVFKCVEIKEQK